MFLFILLFLVSHVLHWLFIYIMRLFMIYGFFFFLFCEIKNLYYDCFFYRISNSALAHMTCRVLCIASSIKGKTLATF